MNKEDSDVQEDYGVCSKCDSGVTLLAGCGKPEAEAPKEEAAVNEETSKDEAAGTDSEKPKLVYIAGDMSNESQVFASKMFADMRRNMDLRFLL